MFTRSLSYIVKISKYFIKIPAIVFQLRHIIPPYGGFLNSCTKLYS